MPKLIMMGRHVPGVGPHPVHVVEFSLWEMLLMVLGREITTVTAEGLTFLRCGICYEAFNLAAAAHGPQIGEHEPPVYIEKPPGSTYQRKNG